MVQQDGEFTSHGYHGSLLGTFSSSGSDPLPIASQVTIRAKRSRDVLGTTDQQFANKPIAGFGNPQLGIPSPGLVLSGSEPQIGSHLATSSKPMGILEGQNKGQSCDRSYSSKLLKVLGRLIGLRISEPGTGGPGDVLCDVGQLGHALRLRGYAATIPDELMAQVFLARLFPATHFLGRIHHSHGVSDRKFCRRLDPAPQDIEVNSHESVANPNSISIDGENTQVFAERPTVRHFSRREALSDDQGSWRDRGNIRTDTIDRGRELV